MAEQDWFPDGELRKKIGKCVQRFVVHIADGTRPGKKIGVAPAIAPINLNGRSGGFGNGKIPPMRNRSRTFMEQDDFSRAPAAAHNALNLKAVPLHSQMEGVFWLPALRFIVHCKDPFPRPFRGGHFPDTPALCPASNP